MALTDLSISLEKGLRSIFIEQLAKEQPLTDLIATTVKSNSNLESYGFLSEAPTPKLWPTGADRQPEALSEAKMIIENKKYEATIQVGREDLDDQSAGLAALRPRIQELATRAANYKSKLAIDCLLANGNALDGNAYFGDHGAAGNNSLTGSGSTASAISSDLSSSIAAMRSFKDSVGEPFDEDVSGGLLVLCSPQMERAMQEVLSSVYIGGGNSNVMQNAAKLKVTSRLADADDWYVFVTNKPVKPLIFQDRDPIEFGALENSSQQGFMSEVYHYGVRFRCNVGSGVWQRAIKISN
tara:strand:- start:3313 stop:4203 length:891 start_codon:yes stop_codon:yes gene_type:complete